MFFQTRKRRMEVFPMATGPNWNAPGATIGLWKLNFKINTARRGFNMGFHIAEANEATAKTKANKLALHLLAVLPTDSEIVYATISKDDTKKDSRFLRDALGVGKAKDTGPVDTEYDFARTGLLIRFEHAGGAAVPMKLAPLPDSVVTDGDIIDALDDVVDYVGALPADPTVFTVWKTNYASLVKVIILNTNFVKAGHPPGGEYTYFSWQSAFPLRIADKKGGRVFV
jgi:hypothetical protein